MKIIWLIAQFIFLVLSMVQLFYGHNYIMATYYTLLSFQMAILYRLDSKL